MEQKLMNLIAGVMCVFTVALVTVLYVGQGSSVLARQQAKDDLGSILEMVARQQDQLTKEDPEALSHHLALQIPAQVDPKEISITQEGDLKRFQIKIPDISTSYFYDYPMAGNCEGIVDLTYDESEYGGRMELTCDGIYVMKKTVRKNRLYLDLYEPGKCFDAMFVVDAGHGGNDSGAMSGGVYEKDMNQAIVRKIKDTFDAKKAPEEKKDVSYVADQFSVYEQEGIGTIGVYYTRLTDRSVRLQDRAALANRLPADLFLSVHINSTATGRTSTINGTAVMYQVSDKSKRSKEFSQLVLNKLLKNLGSNSKGLIAGDEIYIVRTAKMPVALAEIGFITNEDERKKMLSDDYQQKCADAICQSMEEYLQKIRKK